MTDDKLNMCAEGYRSGIYTKDEAVTAIIELLVNASEFSSLWVDVPDWAQSGIWTFLKPCDKTSLIFDGRSRSVGLIDPRLIKLKSWLIDEMGYE